ncbi:MAG TPA: chloramphenicol acetyltransferase, partial [Candidatus Janibacter merdipullorum]|nr:chloramphenicol acetyltransferase [Candidatus Janibacter merdipullorum]
FTLHVENGWDHVSPVFTLGKHEERAGRRIMPVALQIHHCAADGFHAAQLLDDLEQLMTTPDWVHR